MAIGTKQYAEKLQTWLRQFRQNSNMTAFDDHDQKKKVMMRDKAMCYVIKVTELTGLKVPETIQHLTEEDKAMFKKPKDEI